jgi:serine/threonine protein kinase
MESLEDIFLKARGIRDTVEQAAYLAKACGGDPELREHVEGMLRDAAGAESFFKDLHPPRPADRQKTMTLAPLSETEGTIIGRYKLLQKIGEGGMGVVYMAEQREPVIRKVALKIIKLGMDTKQVVARFEAERQALALMDHPNIAKVLDGGATETGRPYFVMELVQGLSITQFCDEASLPTRDRLHLFLDVCSAIQHAHQKGIIHRDIKPSNILVTVHGDKPVPNVIDFGVAKATQGRLTEKTFFTQFQQFIGTPAYMSPEQASLSGLDVDTRSDIYGLGVLLYELLTGKTPFDAKDLVKEGLERMAEIIREQEPPRPSTRLNTLEGDDLTKTARFRHTEAPKLIHQVRGDLDWIVMKCLEKDRGRRYETANGLATDLQRHLANEPVAARPPSTLYRMQKAIRRNRVVFTAAGAIGAALVLGLTVSIWLLMRERAALERAVTAEREQTRLRAVAEVRRAQAEALLFADQGVQLGKQNDLAGAESLFRQSLDNSRMGWPDTPSRWAPGLGGLMDVLLRRTNFQAADDLMREVVKPEFAKSTNAIGLTQIRSEFFARRGRWKEAVEDARRVLEFQPTNYLHYHRLLPQLVAAENIVDYRKFSQQMAARFADTKSPVVAEETAKDCLILPDSGVDLQTVSNLALFAVSSRIRSPEDQAIFQYTKGLAEYRQGNSANAVEWLQQSILTTSNIYPYVEAYAVLAMAQYRLHQTAQATATFARGVELQKKESPRLEDGDLTGDWRAWVRGQVLMKEARALIEGTK